MMLIWNDICQYLRKYAESNKNICHFLGWWPSAIRKKSKAQKQIKMIQRCAPDFFDEQRARWWSRVMDFLPGFTDKDGYLWKCRLFLKHSRFSKTRFSKCRLLLMLSECRHFWLSKCRLSGFMKMSAFVCQNVDIFKYFRIWTWFSPLKINTLENSNKLNKSGGMRVVESVVGKIAKLERC